ncbi:MAG: hypothetical protein ACI4QT_03585 [Kiritimatiellia bacterium]
MDSSFTATAGIPHKRHPCAPPTNTTLRLPALETIAAIERGEDRNAIILRSAAI